MFDVEDITEWRGRDVVDSDGERIGRLEEIYFDRQTNEPGFGCVRTGLFGRRLTFVPLARAAMGRDYIRVVYTKDEVKNAPTVEPDGQLTGAEEAELFRYYGFERVAGGDGRLVRYQTEGAAAAEANLARREVATHEVGASDPSEEPRAKPAAGVMPTDAPPASDEPRTEAAAGVMPTDATPASDEASADAAEAEPSTAELRLAALERRVAELERRVAR